MALPFVRAAVLGDFISQGMPVPVATCAANDLTSNIELEVLLADELDEDQLTALQDDVAEMVVGLRRVGRTEPPPVHRGSSRRAGQKVGAPASTQPKSGDHAGRQGGPISTATVMRGVTLTGDHFHRPSEQAPAGDALSRPSGPKAFRTE